MRGGHDKIDEDNEDNDRTPIRRISNFPMVRVCSPGGGINNLNNNLGYQ